ncbi:hypothetical protein LA080_004520 [Diaporthe eres]|uniref:Actin-like ATPase domain-containing protein n=1 Tax=Diaporthe vaccinii TaxID=105482 RepID=A0ABR4ET40_9PEZI|nr:hypothetical protein LA080_004520 [Diaporthe eres]
MAPKDVRDPEVVLCIDVGSTETRSVYAYPDNDDVRTQVVENRTESEEFSVNATAQFSSSIYPYDGNSKRYVGHADQSGREPTSAKFAPYIIVGTTEEMQQQYHLLNRLQNERNKDGFNEKAFNDRLKEGLKQLLRFVLTEAKRALDTRRLDQLGIRLKTVAMTVPSQWDLDFQDSYERLLKQVFTEVFEGVPQAAADAIDVVFHTEATALAQYIFNRSTSSKTLALGGGMPDIDTVLGKPNAQYFIDCGGHNANGTLATYHRSQDGKAVLYEIDRSQGAGGGTEMWNQDLLDQLAVLYRGERNGDEMPLELQQAFKNVINDVKRKIMSGSSQCVACIHPQTNDPVTFTITKEMSDKAFETGFQYVKNMITGQLKRLASIKNGWGSKDHSITIIVSGGSSLHPEFKKWMNALCVELGLPQPLPTHGMEIQYGSARIAKGGAYATLTQMSVASFAEKCAFGLQKGNARDQGEDSEHLEYGDSADTIWYKENGGTIPFETAAEGNRAEYRIVCQPYLESHREKLRTDQGMAEGASYDFLDLGILPDGYLNRIEFNLDAAKEQAELKIVLIPLPFSNATDCMKRKAAMKEKVLSLGPFPVHVQPGTLCLLFKQPMEEIDELVRGALDPFRPEPVAKSRADRDNIHRGKIPGSTRQPKAIAPQTVISSAAAPKAAAANINKTPAGNTSAASVNEASSASSAIASRATNSSSAFRVPNASSGNDFFDRQAAHQVLNTSNTVTTTDSRPGNGTKRRHSNNVAYGGEASASRHMISSSKATEAQGSASASRKRPAPTEADNSPYIKRACQRDGILSEVTGPPEQAASPRQPGRDRLMSSSASQHPFASSSGAQRYMGSAFRGRDQPAASEFRHSPRSRHNPTNDRPSSNMNDQSGPNPRSSQVPGAQAFQAPDRRRENGSGARAVHTARRNPHNVSLNNRPIGRAPSPPPRHGTATPRTTPTPNFISGSFPVGSPRPGSSSRSAQNSGPAGRSQHPQGFNGFRQANRGGNPPRSD